MMPLRGGGCNNSHNICFYLRKIIYMPILNPYLIYRFRSESAKLNIAEMIHNILKCKRGSNMSSLLSFHNSGFKFRAKM